LNKKIALAAAAVAVLFTTAAVAADMAPRYYAKAPPPAAIAIYNWTGFYVGVHGGGAWAHTNVRDVDAYAEAALPGTVTTVNTSGFLAGGQIGYNWQASQYVLGIEADGGWMDIGGTTPLTAAVSGTRVGLRSGSYGDITARLGLAFNSALLYVKGGWAILDDASQFGTVSGSFSGRTAHSYNNGYVIGAGLEYGFTPNWSAKVEYLHFGFGNTLNYTVIDAVGTPFRFNQDLTVETVKVGVNYRFGGPLVARY